MIRVPWTQKREATGAIQLGDDWPGVFIRGDDCFFYSHYLKDVLRKFPVDAATKLNLEELTEILDSAFKEGQNYDPGTPV